MEPPRRLLAYLASCLVFPLVGPSGGQEVFINELHYDNAGSDVEEAVEIAGPSGTDLARYRIVLYNGANGEPYFSSQLSGVLPNEDGSGSGAAAFAIPGIQNGAPDGIALWDARDGRIVQFLSYEGRFFASSGVAAGLESTDIGVAESGTTEQGTSLQVTGAGSVAPDFQWTGPVAATFGRLNAGQELRAVPVRMIRLGFGASTIPEGSAGGGTTLRLDVDPPPDSPPLLVTLASEPTGELIFPAEVAVDGSGVALIEVTGVADGIPDGNRRVRIAATDPGGGYNPGYSSVVVEDADSPNLRRADLRVATYNLENGPGPEGSAKFEAIVRVLRRIDADVVAFQEATEDFDFRDLRALVAALGFPDSTDHLAIADDRFAGEPFMGGDFPSNQNVALASRYPIREIVQIGRGEGDGRREMTRYPLYATVDVPSTPEAADPAFVVVHLKAGSDDADRFRKAIEGHRIASFLEARSFRGDSASVFILGDFNEDIDDAHPSSFSTTIDPATHLFGDGTFLPATYRLGSDLTGIGSRSIAYSGFPLTPFSALGFAVTNAVQLDGSDRTRTDSSPRRLDYIILPERVFGFGNAPIEVYNSGLERAGPGLPKAFAALDASDTVAASDHHPLFADIELAPKPRLLVDFDRPFFSEDSAGVAAHGTVMLPDGAPDGAPLEVRLGFGPWGEAVPSSRQVIIPVGATEARFEFVAVPDGVPDPDRVISVSAVADGFSTGHGSIVSRNVEASGRVLITRLFEPATGVAPRAAELRNVSGGPINLEIDPLIVRVYANGSSDYREVARVNDGILAPGAVIVVGDAESAAILAGRGLFDAPAGGFARFPDGWVFDDAVGAPVFVLTNPLFNGDDAIEVLVGHLRADVFGQIGEDPGSAWFGEGVLTRDSALERLSLAAHGASGFTDPSLRFRTIPSIPPLSGFGTPWEPVDMFRQWLENAGLPAGDAFVSSRDDTDGDGFGNLLEFAWGTNPLRPDRVPSLTIRRTTIDLLTVSTGEVPDGRGIEWLLEASEGDGSWAPVPSSVERIPAPSGSVRIEWEVPLEPEAGGRDHLVLRVRVRLL